MLLGKKKKFSMIDFSKHYGNNKTIELSGFEQGDLWRGNYTYDSERVFEGETSITLSSWYGKENAISKTVTTTVPPGYTNGYVSIYITDKKNLASLVFFSLELTSEKNEQKIYDLTPLVRIGWNRIPLIIPNWKKITKNTFTITSKKDMITEVNIDRLWIENTSAYNSDILSSQSKSLSLRTVGDRTYLFSASTPSETYGVTNPEIIQEGIITFSLIPEHGRELALSINNTVMKISGKNNDECLIYEGTTKTLVNPLKKTSAKDNTYVFLKADIQGRKIIYSISNNGLDYESCGNANFSKTSPLQLSLRGSYLIDSFSAEY